MPSTATFRGRSRSSISASSGCALRQGGARGRVPPSVSSSSRHGGAHNPCSADLQGALVGDLERADLLDLVAPELQPQRVLLGRREDVDDAAAHRELTAPLDQVDPRVRRGGQAARRGRRAVARRPRGLWTGTRSASPRHLRLQHAAHRRDDDPQRAGARLVGVGMDQAAQDGEAAPDGVAARREPLVRQRLPGGVLRHQLARQQAGQRLDELLGLALGRGDDEHRAPGTAQVVPAGQRGDHQRAQRAGSGEVQLGSVRAAGSIHRGRQGRVGHQRADDTGQAHGIRGEVTGVATRRRAHRRAPVPPGSSPTPRRPGRRRPGRRASPRGPPSTARAASARRRPGPGRARA